MVVVLQDFVFRAALLQVGEDVGRAFDLDGSCHEGEDPHVGLFRDVEVNTDVLPGT